MSATQTAALLNAIPRSVGPVVNPELQCLGSRPVGTAWIPRGLAWHTHTVQAERSGVRLAVSVLAVVVGFGVPVGLLAAYPFAEEDGLGVMRPLILFMSIPIVAWAVFLAVSLATGRSWARWLTAFTFYMVAGIAARQALVGGPRNDDFLLFVRLLLLASVVIVVLLLLPERLWDQSSG